jgi:hypothetical protein
MERTAEVVVGRSVEARHPLGKRCVFVSAKAVTDMQLVRIGDDLLDGALWHGDRLQ